MTIQELNYQALQRFFPGECSVAGKKNVEAISSGQAEIIRTQHGANFDISIILATIAAAAAMIDAIINVINLFKKEKKQMPTPIQINIAIEKRINLQLDISQEKRNDIYKYLLDKIEEEGMIES